MKKMLKYIALGIAVSLVLAGCAKPPEAEKTAAQVSIDAAVAAGANVYGKDELQALNSLLAQAEDQIKSQEGKLFKKYDEAKATLAKAKADAESLTAEIPARKEEAKKNALAALEAAKAAVSEAKALLAKAPKGKGTKADIEAMTADLKGLEDSLPGVQGAITAEDFYGASDKAKAINDGAARVAEQVKAAIEKKTGKRP